MSALSFGEKLLLLRRKKGVSQVKLAKKLDLVVQNISRYENGEYLPKSEVLLKLSNILDVSIDYLLIPEHQNPEIVNFRDTEFLGLLKKIDLLPDLERKRFKKSIQSYLLDLGDR